MENTLTAFEKKRAQNIINLERISKFLQLSQDLGFKIEPEYLEKIANQRDINQNEKLKVALVGGFSEGKTSIAAAWMERIHANMKINQGESSSAVEFYDAGPKIQLIDTPGLFGFKSKINDKTNEIENYKDITKKYLSESHLILYVMNSTNPIKESHAENLHWIFRDLELLSRTIFVLSRFDEVCDVESIDDYNECFAIKKENIAGRLKKLLTLTDSESRDLSIVAVAANPFDQGMEYWLANLDLFRQLSRITELQNKTTEKISASGAFENLIEATRASIVKDILYKELQHANEHNDAIQQETIKLRALSTESNLSIENLNKNISIAQDNLRNFIVNYFSKLIQQAKGLSPETFDFFFEKEIGKNAINMETRILSEFQKQCESVNLSISSSVKSINNEFSHFSDIINALGGKSKITSHVSNFVTTENLRAARDLTVTAGNAIGINLGSVLKMKPYGFTKLASGLGSFLAVAGVLIEVHDWYKNEKAKNEFTKSITSMTSEFEEARSDLLRKIETREHFEVEFFPQMNELKTKIRELNEQLICHEERSKEIQQWKELGDQISASLI